MKRIPWVAMLASVLVAAGAAWWWMNFERVPASVHVGLRGAAQDDPYLAFKRLLPKVGIQVEEPTAGNAAARVLAALPPGGTVIMRARREALMTGERVRTLMRWVESGGHLIVESERIARPDPLLAACNVGAQTLRAAPIAPAGANNMPNRPPQRPLAHARLPGGTRALEIEFASLISLTDLRRAADWKVEDAVGTRVLSMPRGAGRVTAVANLDWITYRGTIEGVAEARQPVHIGKYDHAEAIVGLIRMQPGAAATQVWLLGGHSDLSLWRWLADNAWMALAGLAALITLWLWRAIARFGPLAPAPAPAELRLASHLEASGRFFRKHLALPEIYQGLRNGFMQRLLERRPAIAARTAGARNAELALLIGVRAESVARALDAPALSVGEMVRDVALLQRLAQKL